MLYILLSSLLTAIFILLILLILFFLIMKNIKGSSSKTSNKNYCKKQKNAKTIILSFENISYDAENNPFENKQSFFNLKEKLKDIAVNNKIEKIIIDVNNCPFTSTQVEELYPIFKKLNKTKKVIALSKLLDNTSYMVALLADKIYLENTINSTLLLRGYYRKLCYFKDFFNKVGIDFKILHIGDYKAAGENFSRKYMSNTLKENLNDLYNEKLQYFIDFVKERRNVDITVPLLQGKLFLNEDPSLIDGRLNIGQYLKKEEHLFQINNYKIKRKEKSKNTLAVITLEGQIKQSDLSYEQVEEKIDRIKDIKNLKGIVLEINSPGGSAYDSSLIHSYITENIDVPIFVSMKDVCASGGYFIATTGKKIFANQNTITGSIGVVSMYPIVSSLAKKIGLNYDGLQYGKTTEYGNLYEHLQNDTKDGIIDHMNKVYNEFKSVVIKSRHMSDTRLERIAQGRVWSAKDAKYNGLIDDIKTTDEVIQELANYLDLKDYKVVKINKKWNFKNYAKGKLPLLKYSEYLNVPLMLFDEKFI